MTSTKRDDKEMKIVNGKQKDNDKKKVDDDKEKIMYMTMAITSKKKDK